MRLTLKVLFLTTLLFSFFSYANTPCAVAESMLTEVPQWTVFETQFNGDSNYSNPFQDVDVSVSFKSPTGKIFQTQAFWDGDNIWRVRFSPEEIGKWTFVTHASKQN